MKVGRDLKKNFRFLLLNFFTFCRFKDLSSTEDEFRINYNMEEKVTVHIVDS